MSVEIEAESRRLDDSKTQLLSYLNKFDALQNDDIRISILNLVNTFSDGLTFLKSEIQFEYDFDFAKPIRTKDEDLLRYALNYDKNYQFLQNFKKNFVEKQNELKELEIKRFQQAKRDKYGPKETNELFNENGPKSTENPSASTNSKIMATTKKITSKLTQSSQILQSSLVQSQLNMEELTIQSDSLTYLSDRYGYLKGVLEKSDGFIKDIKLSSERDKKRMYYALIFFGLCVFKVFWGRLFKLPVMFVFKIIFYMFKLSLAAIGLISKKNTEVDFPSTMIPNQPIATPSLSLEDGITSSTVNNEAEETGDTVFKSTDSEDSAYEEELSRIIDEL